MIDWLTGNVGVVAALAAVLLATSLLLLVLLLRSAHNGRLLSGELDAADREIAKLETGIAERAARLRIVRELHEVAVGSISAILRQAEGSRYVVQTDPTSASRSAGQIADLAAGALTDLRRIVTIAGESETPTAAQPSIAAAAELIATMTGAGLTIGFTESGEKFELQQGADVAIYRILEESLANALTYGGTGTDVRVSFTWTAEGLQVLVDDDGVQAAARRDGLDPNELAQQRSYTFQDDLNALTEVVEGEGLTEMRQRTVAYRGVFNAYAVPGVGFSVQAIFPALRYDNGVHGVNLAR
ncbi:signal transduction histidine kinase [Marisediminicola sp. UYEF4]|uniref:sensor histidine kinase n=1 Tax=Marisediminicola sp. UYEF4 TaxID=1756384 RepID=UPI003391CB6D